MNTESRGTRLGWIWPSVVFSVAGVYSYFSTSTSLQTQRPTEAIQESDEVQEAKVAGVQYWGETPARSWDDPLGKDHRGKESSAAALDKDQLRIKSCDQLLVMPVLVRGGRNESERRRRTRFAVLSGLNAHGYRSVYGDQLKLVKVPDVNLVVACELFSADYSERLSDPAGFVKYMNLLVCWIDSSRLGDQPLAGLTKIVSELQGAEPDVKRDWRTRVIGPADSAGLIDMALECAGRDATSEPFASLGALRDRQEAAAVRRFSERLQTGIGPVSQTNDNSKPASQPSPFFDSEVAAIREKFGDAITDEKAIAEFKRRNDYRIQVYSPFATLHPDFLKRNRQEVENHRNIAETVKSFLNPPDAVRRRHPLLIVPTIGTDENLAHALSEELVLRSAWPNPPTAIGQHAITECVVLITERDGPYGRIFPRILARQMRDPYQFSFTRSVTSARSSSSFLSADRRYELQLPVDQTSVSGLLLDGKTTWKVHGERVAKRSFLHDAKQPSQTFELEIADAEGESAGTARLNLQPVGSGSPGSVEQKATLELAVPIMTYEYQRGVDGDLSQGDGKGHSNSKQTADLEAGGLPSGTTQFDYLNRMQRELWSLNKRLKLRGGRGVLAIGVVGSDVYDKLIVLRALMPRFSDVVFFTTDLDESFSRPSELGFTRNLVVASHFGLKLHPALQRDVSPFRDGYQTSTLFAVLMAVEDQRLAKVVALPNSESDYERCRLWRNHRGEKEAGVEPQPSEYLGPLIFEIGNEGSYQITMTEERDPPLSIAVMPGKLKEPLSARVHPSSLRETHSWSARRFVWVALGSVVGLAFLALIVRDVHRFVTLVARHMVTDLHRMGAKLRLCHPPEQTDGMMPGWITGSALFVIVVCLLVVSLAVRDHSSPRGEPLSFVSGISMWPTVFLRMAAMILSVGLFCKCLYDTRERTRLPELADPLTTVGWRGYWDRLVSLYRNVSLGAVPASDQAETLRQFYFAEKGSLGRRVLRSSAPMLLYLVVAFLTFELTSDFPNSPHRGALCRGLAIANLAGAVVWMTWLAFLVADAIRLVTRFVNTVKERTIRWSAESLAGCSLRAHPDTLSELLSIREIASRTRLVGRLLAFPCIVLLIMIVSRHHFFDRLTTPLPLYGIIGVLFLLLVVYSAVMRRAAYEARREVIGRLRSRLSHPAAGEDSAERIRLVIEEVEREEAGAFEPLSNDYIFRALAIPFGGTGGLLLIEKLLSL